MINEQLAALYAGCVLTEYRHLYIIGPLLTPGSRLVARMIKLQDEMELPIGLVLKESGHKLPDTHLVDPIAALRRMRIANFTLPGLLRKRATAARRIRAELPPSLEMGSDPDRQVY